MLKKITLIVHQFFSDDLIRMESVLTKCYTLDNT